MRERRLRDLCKQEGRCVARHTQPPSGHSTHSPDAPPAPTFAPHPTPLATGELHALGERVVDAAVDAELAASSHALHAEAPAAGVDAMVHEVRGACCGMMDWGGRLAGKCLRERSRGAAGKRSGEGGELGRRRKRCGEGREPGSSRKRGDGERIWGAAGEGLRVRSCPVCCCRPPRCAWGSRPHPPTPMHVTRTHRHHTLRHTLCHAAAGGRPRARPLR